MSATDRYGHVCANIHAEEARVTLALEAENRALRALADRLAGAIREGRGCGCCEDGRAFDDALAAYDEARR
jgi:hypothetical protein